jgi:hypothetical protein
MHTTAWWAMMLHGMCASVGTVRMHAAPAVREEGPVDRGRSRACGTLTWCGGPYREADVSRVLRTTQRCKLSSGREPCRTDEQ